MNWDDVRVFLAVARSGQILGAARTLGLNHATVARRMTALEKDIGTVLFDRRTTGTDLTAEGEVFLTFAERMESEMLNGREATSSRDLAVSGTVRVGAPDGFGVAYLAPRLVTLSELYPELSIELVPVPRSFSLSRREADIAVTLERPRQGRLVARKLTDYTLGLYAARSYLERYGTPGAAEELAGHRLVGYVEDLIFSDALNYTDLFLSGWRSKIAVSSAMGQTVAVRSGAGIGILHGFMARAEAGLVPVLPDLTIKREYWLVVHEDVRALRRIKIVADFLSDLVKGDAAIFV